MKFKLLKASDWEVLRRHHDTENGEDYYYIWGPDGEYCDADGEPYHFDSREDALEEVEYLKAEHKFDKKSYKYPRIEKEGNIYHVLYAEGTKSKQFDNKEDAEEFKKSISSKLNKKAGESYGWYVDSSEAWDKLQLWIDTVGAEAALDDIAHAMGTDELSECLAFIFRNNDFKEGCSDYEEEVDE